MGDKIRVQSAGTFEVRDERTGRVHTVHRSEVFKDIRLDGGGIDPLHLETRLRLDDGAALDATNPARLVDIRGGRTFVPL